MHETKDPDSIEVGYVPDNDDESGETPKPRKSRRPSAKGDEDLRDELNKLTEESSKQAQIIKQVQAERDEFQDKYLRTLAEMDNFRKRISKEKEDYQRFVLGEFLLGLLEVYDNFERAIRAHEPNDSPKSILSGVHMIFKQLQELLRKNHVEELDPSGRPFDPNFHQALSKEESPEIHDPTVVEVYQKGFLYNTKLLRPALVRVAIPASPSNDNGTDGEGDS